MRVAYLDCSSGISGDMTLGALVDAGIPLAEIQLGIDSLGLPSCRLEASSVKKKGFRATHIRVLYEPEHKHRHLHHITDMIDRSTLTGPQQESGPADLRATGRGRGQGAWNDPGKSPFPRSGCDRLDRRYRGCRHRLATAGCRSGRLFPHSDRTGDSEHRPRSGQYPGPRHGGTAHRHPARAVRRAGRADHAHGSGHCRHVGGSIWRGPRHADPHHRLRGGHARSRGTAQSAATARRRERRDVRGDLAWQEDQVWVLETNLDDVPGEWIAYCAQCLLEAGALDVYTTPIQMKKNRPGIVLSVLCQVVDIARLEQIMFAETGSLGVRRWPAHRHTLQRRAHEVATPWGNVTGKLARLADGTVGFAPEYESCRQAGLIGRSPVTRDLSRGAACFRSFCRPAAVVEMTPGRRHVTPGGPRNNDVAAR